MRRSVQARDRDSAERARGGRLVKLGAHDHLAKGRVNDDLLAHSMICAIETHRLLTALEGGGESAETRLWATVHNTPVITFALDHEGVFTLSEGKGLKALGREPGDLVDTSIFDEYRDVPEITESVRAALDGEPRSLVVQVRGVTLEARYQPVRDRNGQISGVVGVAHDVTERQRLGERFLHSQKMEAVGELVGGIAHDFNNVLSAILGYSELGMATLAPDAQERAYLGEIQKAAERASDLTRQLLAFSRRRVFESRVLNLNDLVLGLSKTLRRLIGEDVEFVFLPARDLGHVEVDPGQMEQVLMNLAINARDAMPDGGTLAIETADLAPADCQPEKLPESGAARYVMLAVSDTGIGMAEEVRVRAFEPFFTANNAGRGTGLGLSACDSIVAQNGGHIQLESEQGNGTTVTVYLPRVESKATPLPVDRYASSLPSGNETVLLAEDDPLVRGVATHILREQGYVVLEAANGHDALRLAEERPGQTIDLLLTDLVMPLMGGKELAERIVEARPETRVLYTSGYTADIIVHYGIEHAGSDFMQKPFTPAVLTHKVRAALEGR